MAARRATIVGMTSVIPMHTPDTREAIIEAL